MPLSNQVVLIVNPVSGFTGRAGRLARLRQALQEGGFDIIEHQTAKGGDAARQAASADQATRAVLVHGGDGTVREVAAGLAGRNIPMYHLPAGNENLYAKHFGMTGKVSSVLASLRQNRVGLFDLMDVSGTLCTSCLGVGFDAEVVRQVTIKRRGHISDFGYAGPIWRTYWSYRWPTVKVQAEGKTVFDGQGMVFVGNLTRYAVGIPLFRHALGDDGLLDVVIFPCGSRATFLKYVVRTMLNRHLANSVHFRTTHVSISGPAQEATQVDGDCGPSLPLEASVRPKAMAVLLPAR